MTEVVKQVFEVKGMHCASCGMLVDDAVEDLDGVRRSQTKLRTGRATVEYDSALCTPEDILGAITEAGYQAVARS